MAQHYILDGYNIVKQIPDFADRRLEDGRECLIRYLEVHAPQGSRNNRVTVVFDGQPGYHSVQGTPHVKVLFSCDESADDRIKKMVAGLKNARSTRVVTDDREIQVYVRRCGAGVITVRDFLNEVRTHRDATFRSKRKDARPRDRKTIDAGLAQEINAEMTWIWLEKDKRRNQI